MIGAGSCGFNCPGKGGCGGSPPIRVIRVNRVVKVFLNAPNGNRRPGLVTGMTTCLHDTFTLNSPGTPPELFAASSSGRCFALINTHTAVLAHAAYAPKKKTYICPPPTP